MEPRSSDQAADEAGAWDARLRAPDCTDDDRAGFAAWRDADPEHRLAFDKLQAIVTAFRNNMGRADVRALRDAALRAPRRHWWHRLAEDEDYPRSRKTTVTAATAVALLAIGVTTWTTLPETARRDPFRELVAVAERISGYALARTYRTGIGQRSTVTLEDGSSVELNAKTRIAVAFNEQRRNVELTEGQALFHVAKNAQRPFVVRAGNRDIVAVGTAFDVRLDATTVRVTLIEGKVKVSRESSLAAMEARESKGKATGSASLKKAEELPLHSISMSGESRAPKQEGEVPPEIFLTPGQQLIAELDSSQRVGGDEPRVGIATGMTPEPGVVVRTTDVAKVTGWRDGRVFLEDLTLEDAVTEMNKYSQVQIRIDDPALTQVRVNGMFRAGEQQAFVTALQNYFPIAVRRDGDTGIVLARER